ncbi:MAG TPA: spore maturation protein [Tepidisphaeraceae bacterium]|nr:spore maturation protein [Tepidisphaeraceae bacterium]
MSAYKDIVELSGLWILVLLLVGLPLYGLLRRVPVYETFIEGAREGFDVSIRIIPYLVAILFAIAMFRASGAMEMLVETLRAPLSAIGFPPEVLPMAIVRPLSGSGSAAVLVDIQAQHGTNSVITQIAATIFGSTETTFYVIAVYFGAVGVRKTRHAVAAGLTADIVAIVLAVYVVQWMLG